MYRILEYTLLFVVAVLLQVFVFDSLRMGPYANIFMYIVFVILLPMEMNSSVVLLLSALMGVTMDIFMGTPGLNTISTVLIGFCRPTLLRVFVGSEEMSSGGTPNMRRIGNGKFISYSLLMVLIHGVAFFVLESMSLSGVFFLLLRMVSSAIFTFGAVYLLQLLFVINRSKI